MTTEPASIEQHCDTVSAIMMSTTPTRHAIKLALIDAVAAGIHAERERADATFSKRLDAELNRTSFETADSNPWEDGTWSADNPRPRRRTTHRRTPRMTSEQSSIDQAAMVAISGLEGAEARAVGYTYFIAGANAGIAAERDRAATEPTAPHSLSSP